MILRRLTFIRAPAIPIIAYTANDDRAMREECLAAGCTDVLAKPQSTADLVAAVASHLGVTEPIVSKLAGNPEMSEFIHDFVTSLPGKIDTMRQLVQAKDAEKLGPLARQLMVAASDSGGSGFGELSAAADALARTLTETVDWTLVEESICTLADLSRRVRETSD